MVTVAFRSALAGTLLLDALPSKAHYRDLLDKS